MARISRSQDRNTQRIAPFPVHKLKRVDRPTVKIDDSRVCRVDERDGGFQRAHRGEFGPHIQSEYDRFMKKHPLSGALLDMTRNLAPCVDGEVLPTVAPDTSDPELMARHIKETAYFLRSDMVGICKLPSYAVFTHSRWDGKPVKLDHEYAIAIMVDQDWKTSAATTGSDWISNSMSFVAYSTSAFIACVLADYIRHLGYEARAHHAMNYQVLVPPILLWAGLGEVSRMGDSVVNPFLGPRFKAAVVTTNMPLAVDKPIDFGLQDFCSKCLKCAQHCPAGAISDGDKVMDKGYERWPLDVEKCTKMRIGNRYGSGCGTCIKVCPWNKPYTQFHRLVNWTIRNFAFTRRVAVWGDNLMGYERSKKEWKWWLDREIIDGEITVPPVRAKHR